MTNMVRRLFRLGLFGGGGYAGWLLWQQRSSTDTDAAPEWPPLDPPSTDTPKPAVREHAAQSSAQNAHAPEGGAAAAPRWVTSNDGVCPDGYPIKANDNSGIFHRPGGRFYDRTVPERCYASPEDAEADGYRAAKS